MSVGRCPLFLLFLAAPAFSHKGRGKASSRRGRTPERKGTPGNTRKGGEIVGVRTRRDSALPGGVTRLGDGYHLPMKWAGGC